MKTTKVFSFLLALCMLFGSFTGVFAEERKIESYIENDIGFVGGDFENVTLKNGKYVAPEMYAYTTYGTSTTIAGVSTKSTGEGELPIVLEDGDKIFKLQPTSLANAVSGKSLNNAFGFRLLNKSNYGKIKDITGDVVFSFKIKVQDNTCLDRFIFAIRPSHTHCGQWATSGKVDGQVISSSEIYGNSIKNLFPSGEWVDVELTFPKSIFYDKEDFATHTWGGSHGSCVVSEENAVRNPVFYVRPFFNYGTTSKSLDNYTVYLDDFAIDAPTSAADEVVEYSSDLVAGRTWTKSTMGQATVITDVSKNGASAWKFQPALDTSITGFRPDVDTALWERFGQRPYVTVPLNDITFDVDSWYKVTAYVMVEDGVAANATLGTPADSTKTWVGKPIFGIKLTGATEQGYETADLTTRNYFRNTIISEGAKTNWQKIELCFKPITTSFSGIQFNATAGISTKYWGDFVNMVLPTYWLRKDITIEKIDTSNIGQGENIVDTAAPYYIPSSGNDKPWLYADNGIFTVYPKVSGRPAKVLSWNAITYFMNQPLDSSKNYKISFDIETNNSKFTKAKVSFNGEDSSAALIKMIPEEANGTPVRMEFDTRKLKDSELTKDAGPLEAIGGITSIDIAVDAGSVARDGSIGNDAFYKISNLKIERIEPALNYSITLSGKVATLTVENNTDVMWAFEGMVFANEYTDENELIQLASNENVKLYVEPGETVSTQITFDKDLTPGNNVKGFLWDKVTLKPIINEAVILR